MQQAKQFYMHYKMSSSKAPSQQPPPAPSPNSHHPNYKKQNGDTAYVGSWTNADHDEGMEGDIKWDEIACATHEGNVNFQHKLHDDALC
jgi:hypothetical protein